MELVANGTSMGDFELSATFFAEISKIYGIKKLRLALSLNSMNPSAYYLIVSFILYVLILSQIVIYVVDVYQ